MKVQYAPCIKCGGTEIVFADAGESAFNYAYGKCQNKKCSHEVNFDCGIFIEMKDIVAAWNKQNDFELLAKAKEAKIKDLLKSTIPELKRQVKVLRQIKKQRTKEAAQNKPITPLHFKSVENKNTRLKVSEFEIAKGVILKIDDSSGEVKI